MCSDNVRKFTAVEHLISKWQEAEYSRVQLLRAVAEDVDAELESFTVVTLVIRKLDKRHYLR